LCIASTIQSFIFSEENTHLIKCNVQWKDKNDQCQDELKRLKDHLELQNPPHLDEGSGGLNQNVVIHVKVTSDTATDSVVLKPSSKKHIAKSKNEAEKLTKALKDIESNIIFDIGEVQLCKVLSKNIPSLENRSVYITKVPVDVWIMKKRLLGWGKIKDFGKKYAIFSEETGRLYEKECLQIGEVVFEQDEDLILLPNSRDDSLKQNLDTLIIEDEEGSKSSIGSKEKEIESTVYQELEEGIY
jgi:hypothetical protein